MKFLTTLVASVALFLSACATTFNQEVHKPLRQATVALETKDGAVFCSGTLIDNYKLLTAAHCDQSIDIYVQGKPAKVVKKNEAVDLMLLEVDLTCPCVPVADEAALMDDEVVAVGFPVGMAQFITKGIVQGPLVVKNTENKMLPHVFAVSTELSPGNSGGGIFKHTADGWKLVGVAHAVGVVPVYIFPNLQSHVALAIKQQVVKQFLE